MAIGFATNTRSAKECVAIIRRRIREDTMRVMLTAPEFVRGISVILFGAILSFAGCAPRLDQDIRGSLKVIAKSPSPSGEYVAIAFHIGGGATTSRGTGVAIRKAGDVDLSTGKGVVYSQDGAVAEIRLTWLAENALHIAGVPDRKLGEIYRQESAYGDIRVTYEPRGQQTEID